MRIHRKILEEGDETRLAADVTDNFIQFSNHSHVLLEAVAGPIDRLHTKRTGPYLIIESNNNNYTLENLIFKKQFRVHINRIVPFLLDPLLTDQQKVAAHNFLYRNVDKLHDFLSLIVLNNEIPNEHQKIKSEPNIFYICFFPQNF